MGPPHVVLLLKGRVIERVPFASDVLRIGRMRENDVVIQNLGVSRFHATLRREGGGFVLEDAGSENGCFVNGERVSRAEIGPDDEIQIGKHQLRLALGDDAGAEAGDDARARGSSDAWDGSATYVVGLEKQQELLEEARGAAGAEPSPGSAPTPQREGGDVAEHPEPDSGGAERSDGAHYAGLILQRAGKLVRVFSWDEPRLTLGRATECDVTLASAEVSRRHALLVHENGQYEVRDLQSINGTYVNGTKVTRAILQVGDVVKVDDFELTFVLEDRPIGDEIKTEAPQPTPSTGRDDGMMTQLSDVSDLAPFAATEATERSAAPSDEEEPATALLGADEEEPATALLDADEEEPATALLDEAPPVDLEDDGVPVDLADEPAGVPVELGDEPAGVPVELGDEPATVLLSPDDEALVEDDDDEKDLAEAPAVTGVVAFEVRVRLEELPPALREAWASLEEAELRLPVELRLRRED